MNLASKSTMVLPPTLATVATVSKTSQKLNSLTSTFKIAAINTERPTLTSSTTLRIAHSTVSSWELESLIT
jgi:hypothetical protein